MTTRKPNGCTSDMLVLGAAGMAGAALVISGPKLLAWWILLFG